jgi:hypothetical protein
MCCLVPSSISIHDLMSDYMLEQWTSSLFIIHCFKKLATCMWPVFFFNLFHLVSTMPCFLLNFVTTILYNYSYATTDYSKHSSFTFILIYTWCHKSWSNLFFFFILSRTCPQIWVDGITRPSSSPHFSLNENKRTSGGVRPDREDMVILSYRDATSGAWLTAPWAMTLGQLAGGSFRPSHGCLMADSVLRCKARPWAPGEQWPQWISWQ